MGQSETAWQTTVELPVGYIHPTSGHCARTATLRKMTGKEEALLGDPKLRSNGGKLITALLANCVTTLEGVTPLEAAVMRQLSSADRNFLLLQLRRLTFGDEMEARYRCPHCQGSTPVLEDLSRLEVKALEAGADPDIQVILRDGYRDPDGRWHYDMVFSLPTGEDEEAAASRRDNNPTHQRDALLARCLKRVGDLEPRRIQALGKRILADLSMADRRLIQTAIDGAAPGPNLMREVICDQCGDSYVTALDMSHFFPLA